MGLGDKVSDRFELIEEVGRGGMGTVWRALDRASGATVALKVVGATCDDHLRERFAREVRLLADLDHPGIVRPIASGWTDDGTPWLAMDWLSGEDMAVRLSRGPMHVEEALAAARLVALALAHAHARSVVHRDVKPGNLFLREGRADDVCVLDFGIAHVADAPRPITRTGMLLGTPSYMSPEQVRGEDVDPRTDVFALGAVLYECLSGRQAFGGISEVAVLARILLDEPPSLAQVAPDCGRTVADLCARMLAKDARARPADGGEVAAELAALAGAERLPTPTTALGTHELRLCSIVLAPGGDDPDRTLPRVSELTETPAGCRRVRIRDGTTAMLFEGASAPELATRAARAALELRGTLPPGAPIAIATGRALTFGRLPAGEAIDRAAELAATPSSGVRVDELTAGLLGDRYEVGADGDGLVLRGHASGRASRTLLGKPAPFFGRAQESAMLEGIVLGAAEEGVARAVLLSGPAGIGKSRLRTELVRSLAVRCPDVQVWTGRADPSREGSPFAPLSLAISDAAGLADEPNRGARRDRLTAFVERRVKPADGTRVAEFIAELCAVPFNGGDRVELRTARADPLLMGDQIRRAVEDLVDGACEVAPLVVVLEDLHWGDAATVDVVDRMLRNLAQRPLVVLALARPEIDRRFPRLWAARGLVTIPVGPLGAKGAERIVRQVLGRDVPDERVRDLIARSEGNAFFLEELVRAASENRWSEAPATVLAIVQSRLEAQDPEARRILRAASVLGDTFWTGAVAVLTGADVDETNRRLDLLASAELVSEGQGTRFSGEREMAFRHAVVREAAYAMLTDDDRALGHHLAAEWLESHGERDALVVALHLERAGQRERAAERWVRAAAQALEASDLSGAQERAAHALELGVTGEPRGLARLVIAEAASWRGENLESAQAATQALEDLPLGCSAFFTACWLVVLSNGRLGLLEGAEAGAASIVRTEPRPGAERARLSAIALTAMRILKLGRLDAGSALLAEIEGAVGADDPTVAAEVGAARAEVAWSLGGDLDASVGWLEVAVREYERSGNVRRACVQKSNVAFALTELGFADEALAILEASLVEAQRMGLRQAAIGIRENVANALVRAGRYEEARSEGARAAEEYSGTGEHPGQGAARMYLAQALLALRDLEAAEREARAATELLRAAPATLPQAHATLAAVLLAAARIDEARVAAAEAMRLVEGGAGGPDALARLVHAEVLLACGEREAATAALRVARERILTEAAKIRTDARRARFLALPEHARTLELWAGTSG